MSQAISIYQPGGVSPFVTVDQCLAAWIDAQHSEKTKAAYKFYIGKFIDHLAEHGYSLQSPTLDLAKVLQDWRWIPFGYRKHAVSKYTANLRTAIVSSLYDYGMRFLFFAGNPARMIDRQPQQAYTTSEPIPVAQVQAVLADFQFDTIVDYRNYAILLLLLSSGRRAQEVVRLTLGDILIDGSTWTITFHTKGDQVQRHVLEPMTREALKISINLAYPDGLWIADRPLWISMTQHHGNTRSMTVAGLRYLIRKYFGTGKIHRTRHTAARSWRRAGATTEDIQRQLGHHDPRTTQIYLDNIDPQENPFAASAMQIFLGVEKKD